MTRRHGFAALRRAVGFLPFTSLAVPPPPSSPTSRTPPSPSLGLTCPFAVSSHPYPKPQATTDVLPVSINLTILDISGT